MFNAQNGVSIAHTLHKKYLKINNHYFSVYLVENFHSLM